MSRGARVARSSGRPTVGRWSGLGGVGRERPGPFPLPPGIGGFGGPGGGVQSWPGPGRPLLSAGPRVGSQPSRLRTLDAEVTLGLAQREPRRGEARRAPSQVGGPGRAPRLPRPGLHSDFSGSPGACQLAGELREGFCWTLVLRETSFVGFWALAESSKYTKTSSESLGAIAVNLRPPSLSLSYIQTQALEISWCFGAEVRVYTLLVASSTSLLKLHSLFTWRSFFPQSRLSFIRTWT